MKRVVVLLLAAFVLMWGGVLLEFGRPAAAPRSGAAEQAAPAEATAAGYDPPDLGPPAPADAVATADEPPALRGEGVATARSPDAEGMGRVVRVGPAAAAASKAAATKATSTANGAEDPDELLGELGEGARSPDFVQLETDYVGEPRDGEWARAEEQRIGALIGKHPIGRQLAMLNCQDSVCRIMLQTESKDAFEQLLQVPGLMAATGLSSRTPYSLRSGQLSVYYRRAATAAIKPR